MSDVHITWSPDANPTAEEMEAAKAAVRAMATKMKQEREAATKALEGLPYVAVPIDQLADIYKRMLRLTRLGQGTIEEWCQRSEAERDLRHAIFEQADFGAVFAGQWLPREKRDEIRHLVKGKRYDHNFDQHEVAYHRDNMDRIVQRTPQ
jgi:hypothetical protein